MSQNFSDHHRIFDCGDDFFFSAAVCANFDIEIEYSFQEPGKVNLWARNSGYDLFKKLELRHHDASGAVGVWFL